MQQFTPPTAQELAESLRAAADKGQSIQIVGRNSKSLMGGPIMPAQFVLKTGGLRKMIHYERDDLTVSAEAGMAFSELQAILAENQQMIALDPPLGGEGTVGGVVASN